MDKIITKQTDQRRAEVDLLFREIGAELWRAVFVFTGGRRAVCDDAVAEAFTRALEHWEEIRDAQAWLYRVAFRIASAEMKRERRSPAASGPGQGGVSLENTVPEGGGVSLEDVLPILEALETLPRNQRAAVVLHYRLDMSTRDVAKVLGISVASTKVHLHRGRNRLRHLLGSEE